MLSRYNTKFVICGAFSTSWLYYRNMKMTTTFIDVRETNEVKFLSPKKINFFFFQYYEYYVSWKMNQKLPVYKFSCTILWPIEFITDDSDMTNPKFHEPNVLIVRG